MNVTVRQLFLLSRKTLASTYPIPFKPHWIKIPQFPSSATISSHLSTALALMRPTTPALTSGSLWMWPWTSIIFYVTSGHHMLSVRMLSSDAVPSTTSVAKYESHQCLMSLSILTLSTGWEVKWKCLMLQEGDRLAILDEGHCFNVLILLHKLTEPALKWISNQLHGSRFAICLKAFRCRTKSSC